MLGSVLSLAFTKQGSLYHKIDLICIYTKNLLPDSFLSP